LDEQEEEQKQSICFYQCISSPENIYVNESKSLLDYLSLMCKM